MKKRRITALLLCMTFVLAVLAGCAQTEIQEEDAPLSENPEEVDQNTCNHNWVNGQWTTEGYDCILGDCHIYYKVCSICGVRDNIAYRDYDTSTAVGSHDWKETAIPTDCPNNPTINRICQKCGDTEVVSGGHKWTDWTATGGSACTAGQSRQCTSCSKTETKGALGHTWSLVKSNAATCTEPATEEQKCNRCGETRTVEKSPALGHNFGGITDCTKERKCVRCNETKPAAGSHSWSEYVGTDQGHYQRCALCSQTTELAAHTDNGAGFCSVCGYKMKANATKPSACAHDYQTVAGSGSAGAHTEKCSKCGATQRVSCADHPNYSARTYCTDPLYCVCGAKISDGQTNHNFGTSSGWTTTATTHERHCLNNKCQYVISEQHTFTASQSCTTPTKCSVCGYASGTAAYSDHAWGPWVNSDSGSHTRSCTHPGCTAKQSASHTAGSVSGDCTTGITCKDCGAVVVAGSSTHAWGHWISSGGSHYRSCTHPGCDAKQSGSHSGGTATCASGAICSDCGAEYGAKNPANHAGGTEIRDAKPAQVGVEGYTGDTYCVGCGQKLSEGQKIEALKADHVHSYGGWVSDSTHHWHECECGDKQDNAAHTFVKGVCSVCGAEDPTFVEHVHTFSQTWNADSQYHWHVCTVCGEKTDITEHVIMEKEDGSVECLTCGLTLKEKVQKERVESAVTIFTDVKETDYFSEYVGWAVTLGITNGTSADSFSPEAQCTEQQILTMLYRAQRAATDPDAKPSADDMEAALRWAREMGMIDDHFDPNAICTRASAVTFMWMAANSPDASGSTFSDVPSDASYAKAVAWAVENGITNGTDANSFSPSNTCNRGQIVTFLGRANGNETQE